MEKKKKKKKSGFFQIKLFIEKRKKEKIESNVLNFIIMLCIISY